MDLQFFSSPSALAIGAVLLTSALFLNLSFKGKPSPKKPYADFFSFYPHYLREHSLPLTKLLHCLGTLCVFAFSYLEPALLLALALAALLGVCCSPAMRGWDTGLLEFAVMLGTYLGCAVCFTGGALQLSLALPASAYSFAWLAHFFVEGNKVRLASQWAAFAGQPLHHTPSCALSSSFSSALTRPPGVHTPLFQPATFIYPSYSLLGDFVMFGECMLGRHLLYGGGGR